MMGLLLVRGLRRSEVAALSVGHIQRREDHWVIVDLVGKGGHIRSVPMPSWVKDDIDAWTTAAGIISGRLFRCIRKNGDVWGNGVGQNVVWYEALDRLHSKGYISDPKGKAKSVVVTDEGITRSWELFEKHSLLR